MKKLLFSFLAIVCANSYAQKFRVGVIDCLNVNSPPIQSLKKGFIPIWNTNSKQENIPVYLQVWAPILGVRNLKTSKNTMDIKNKTFQVSCAYRNRKGNNARWNEMRGGF